MLFLRRENGQSLMEYGLVLVLVAMAVIAALTVLGEAVNDLYAVVVAALQQEPPPEPEQDCYGSLLLPYLVGLTALFTIVFRFAPKRSYVVIEE